MITDATFRAWLNDDTQLRCVLVEIDYRDTTNDALGTEYLATLPFVTLPTDTPPNTAYLARIKSIPEFTQSMSDAMMGETTANLGSITVVGGDAYTDAWLFGRDWTGRGLRVYVGSPTWSRAEFRAVWTGVVGTFKVPSTMECAFEARDKQHLLNQPLRVATIDAGPSVGAPWPLILGPVNNVPLPLVDSTAHKYLINDGPMYQTRNLRQGGNPLPVTPPDADGTITMPRALTAILTADVTGTVVNGISIENAADIIRYMVVARGYFTDDDLDLDSFAAIKILCPAQLGYIAPSADTTVYQAVDAITTTIGAYTAVTREGKFFIKRFDFSGTPVMSITELDMVERGLTVDRVIAPVSEIRLTAGNQSPQAYFIPFVAGWGGSAATETDYAQLQNSYTSVAVASNPDVGHYEKTRTLPNPTPAVTQTKSDKGTIQTCFANPADAAAEAGRRMTLWGVPRVVFNLKCFISPLSLKLGDVVTIFHSRYEMSAGRNAVVIKIKEQLSRKRVELSVIL